MMTHGEPAALAKLTWREVKSHAGKEYVLLEGATATIGRSRSNDICIPERHVSRRHAVIRYEDGGFVIHDLGSANGIFVNNQHLQNPYPLADGDVIRLFVPELHFSAVVTPAEHAEASRTGRLISAPVGGAHPSLIVTSGPQEGAEVPLDRDVLTIGRATEDAAWDIRLDDRAVSRPHARVGRQADGRWYVMDLYSANGTRLNGRVLAPEQPASLQHGDVILVGMTTLLFRDRS